MRSGSRETSARSRPKSRPLRSASALHAPPSKEADRESGRTAPLTARRPPAIDAATNGTYTVPGASSARPFSSVTNLSPVSTRARTSDKRAPPTTARSPLRSIATSGMRPPSSRASTEARPTSSSSGSPTRTSSDSKPNTPSNSTCCVSKVRRASLTDRGASEAISRPSMIDNTSAGSRARTPECNEVADALSDAPMLNGLSGARLHSPFTEASRSPERRSRSIAPPVSLTPIDPSTSSNTARLPARLNESVRGRTSAISEGLAPLAKENSVSNSPASSSAAIRCPSPGENRSTTASGRLDSNSASRTEPVSVSVDESEAPSSARLYAPLARSRPASASLNRRMPSTELSATRPGVTTTVPVASQIPARPSNASNASRSMRSASMR